MRPIVNRIIRNILCSRFVMRNLGNQGNYAEKIKQIYLTFDDGPHKIHTINVLDLLQFHNIQATFFVNGICLDNNMPIAKRIIAEGHVLGNHTYSHRLLPTLSKKELCYEIMSCQQLIDECQFNRARLFRPPQGLMGIRDLLYLRGNKFRTVLWSIDSQDSHNKKYSEIVHRLKTSVQNSSIILFHDDSGVCLEVLKVLLPYWKINGFSFNLFDY